MSTTRHILDPYINEGEIAVISRIMWCHQLATVLFSNDDLQQIRVQLNIYGKGNKEFQGKKGFNL